MANKAEEVNGGSIRSFLIPSFNECCVSKSKVPELLSTLSRACISSRKSAKNESATPKISHAIACNTACKEIYYPRFLGNIG